MSTTLLETPLVGLEDIQRAAFYVFVEGMNNALNEIASYWLPRDEIFDTQMGTVYAPVTLESIPNSNFHEGHKPSLVRGTPEDYPNLAVFAMQADPAPEDLRLDQIDSWLDSILVEVMVKSEAPDPNDMSGSGETICNRRVQRMTEAAILCLRRNPNLGRAVYGLNTRPSVIIGDVFAVRSPSQGGAYPNQPGKTYARTGSRYIWQGAQIRFRVQTDSQPPSSGPGTFAEASQVDYSKFIDQG